MESWKELKKMLNKFKKEIQMSNDQWREVQEGTWDVKNQLSKEDLNGIIEGMKKVDVVQEGT